MRGTKVSFQSQNGLTLVELVVAIVIISVALAGVLLAIHYTVSRSADPMVQHQALAIAESYVEEVLLRPCDFDATPGQTDRTLFDNVADYANLPDSKVRDQNGALIPTLAPYSVTVAPVAANIGPGGSTAAGTAVAVRVTGPGGVDLTLRGWCVNY